MKPLQARLTDLIVAVNALIAQRAAPFRISRLTLHGAGHLVLVEVRFDNGELHGCDVSAAMLSPATVLDVAITLYATWGLRVGPPMDDDEDEDEAEDGDPVADYWAGPNIIVATDPEDGQDEAQAGASLPRIGTDPDCDCPICTARRAAEAAGADNSPDFDTTAQTHASTGRRQ